MAVCMLEYVAVVAGRVAPEKRIPWPLPSHRTTPRTPDTRSQGHAFSQTAEADQIRIRVFPRQAHGSSQNETPAAASRCCSGAFSGLIQRRNGEMLAKSRCDFRANRNPYAKNQRGFGRDGKARPDSAQRDTGGDINLHLDCLSLAQFGQGAVSDTGKGALTISVNRKEPHKGIQEGIVHCHARLFLTLKPKERRVA